MEKKRLSRGELRLWLLAVFVAVATQGIWWLLLAPAEKIPLKNQPASPTLMYLPPVGEEDVDEADVRELWSPVVFSLPTAEGFSKSLLGSSGGLKPPLEREESEAMYLAREGEGNGEWKVPQPDLAGMVARAAGEIAVEAPDKPVFAPVDDQGDVPGVTVDYIDGFLAGDFVVTPFPPALEDLGGNWEVVACMEVDRHGNVAHVILEKGMDEPGMNSLVLRSLHRWRFRESGKPRFGKVAIRANSNGSSSSRNGNGEG